MTPRKIAEVLEARAAGGASGDGPHLRIHEEGLLSRRPVHTGEGAPCGQGAPSVSRLPEWLRCAGQSVTYWWRPGTCRVPPNWPACWTVTLVK